MAFVERKGNLIGRSTASAAPAFRTQFNCQIPHNGYRFSLPRSSMSYGTDVIAVVLPMRPPDREFRASATHHRVGVASLSSLTKQSSGRIEDS